MSRVVTQVMVVVAMALAACTEVPGEPSGESTVVQATETGDCQLDGGCPGNSPVIATYPFHELNLAGQPNKQGFAIVKFVIDGTELEFGVGNGEIYGHRNDAVVAAGAAVTGGELWLVRGTDQYVLKINAVVPVQMWAAPGPGQSPATIRAYELTWAQLGPSGRPEGQWSNLCVAAMRPPHDVDLGNTPNHLTYVFEGERIDPKQRTIVGIDPSWFNLGCAGHTLMKMYMMGHVAAAHRHGYSTTPDERQTVMKMFSADYCNAGYAFTVPGVPLRWQDDRGWYPYRQTSNLQLEARWTPTGASCINLSRVTANFNANAALRARWPNGIEPELRARCKVVPPRCRDSDPARFDGHHIVTANP